MITLIVILDGSVEAMHSNVNQYMTGKVLLFIEVEISAIRHSIKRIASRWARCVTVIIMMILSF